MGDSGRIGSVDKRSFLSLLLVCCLLLSLISTAWANPAAAKSSRTAIVVEATGSVSVKKAGGSKEYTAYADMSLNQGDVIITGADSSAVLRIVDREDEITISDNAEVSIAELAEQGAGKTSKLKSWAGSMWVKVKSLVSSEDEFEVETPTAVMGVRGTQWGLMIDNQTGEIKVILASGKIEATTFANGSSANSTVIFPSQQIDLNGRDEAENLEDKVSILDVDDLVSKASPEVLEAIIRSKAEIDKENSEFIASKKAELEGSQPQGTTPGLAIGDLDALDKVTKNLENIIGSIALAAIEQNKISTEQMNQIVSELNAVMGDSGKKLDLNNVERLDRTAGVDPDKEKAKQAERDRLNAQKAEKRSEKEKQAKDLTEKLKSVLDKIQQDKQRIEAENKKTQEEAKKQAEAQYLSRLSDAERQRFSEQQQKNNSAPGTTTGTPTGGTGSSGGTGSTGSPGTITDPGSSDGGSSGGDDGDSGNNPNPPSQPEIILEKISQDANTATVQLSMQNFSQGKEFYAVEAHLVYGSALSYNGSNELPDVPGTVFDDANKSAETLRQVVGSTKNELIYGASQFEATGSTTPVNDITAASKKVLVTIPLTFTTSASGSTNVDLVYVKVVNKSGATVAEFTTTKSITVTK